MTVSAFAVAPLPPRPVHKNERTDCRADAFSPLVVAGTAVSGLAMCTAGGAASGRAFTVAIPLTILFVGVGLLTLRRYVRNYRHRLASAQDRHRAESQAEAISATSKATHHLAHVTDLPSRLSVTTARLGRYLDQAEISHHEHKLATFWDSFDDAKSVLGELERQFTTATRSVQDYLDVLSGRRHTFPVITVPIEIDHVRGFVDRYLADLALADQNAEFVVVFEQRRLGRDARHSAWRDFRLAAQVVEDARALFLSNLPADPRRSRDAAFPLV